MSHNRTRFLPTFLAVLVLGGLALVLASPAEAGLFRKKRDVVVVVPSPTTYVVERPVVVRDPVLAVPTTTEVVVPTTRVYTTTREVLVPTTRVYTTTPEVLVPARRARVLVPSTRVIEYYP